MNKTIPTYFVKTFLILALFFVPFHTGVAHRSAVADENLKLFEPDEAYFDVKKEIINYMNRSHYRSVNIDDDFTSAMFDNYISSLDALRMYFLESNIKEFQKCIDAVDSELLSGSLGCGYDIFNAFYERAYQQHKRFAGNIEEFISAMQFDTTETFVMSRDNATWVSDQSRLDDLWLKRLKADALNLRLAGQSDENITETLQRRYNNQFNQLQRMTSEDVFQVFMNSFTDMFDPHSVYFSPRQTENFNISMRLSLEGIGAVLQLDNEHTKIIRLVPGGPADRSKQIRSGDLIVSVGQGADGEMVDVVGWRLDDVVELIRGPKGTTVRLEIIPSDARDMHVKRVVSIVRDKVRLEEQAVKKRIIDIERGDKKHKIGIITVPTFYRDFEALRRGDHDYKSTSLDVKNMINELRQEKVAGIVVDLRYNSGGLLQEAIALTGLFIPRGPVVQVKSSPDKKEILEDAREGVAYTGPLAVVINRLSASASEIFAGAIQDYRRGIIIGETSFGKGTVQALQPLSMGQLKYTAAMFYRVSGESTQHRGIIPDILYPSLYDASRIGESVHENALPWERIDAVEYHPLNVGEDILTQLIDRHQERMAHDPDYIYLTEMKQYLDSVRKQTAVSLSEEERVAERDRAEKTRTEIENRRRQALGLPMIEKTEAPADPPEPEDEMENDDEPGKPDPVLVEAGNALIDFMECLTE